MDYVNPIQVQVAGKNQRVGDVLHYHLDRAAELHQRDCVHTYCSFYIADLATA